MRRLRQFFRHFFLINDTPQKVAGGAALGIFLGIFPGEGLFSTLLLSSLFKFNRLSATAAVLAVNMWSTVVCLPLAAGVGSFLFAKNYDDLVNMFNGVSHLDTFKEVFFFGLDIFSFSALPLLTGFVIVSVAISLGLYFLLLYLLKNHKVRFSQ
jgi:uncharacterized protein (DUF2062 family)